MTVENILYFPWELCPTIDPPATRDIPINYLGDKGDLMLTYGGSFLDDPITVREEHNPTIFPMVTNQALSPGFGSMKSTEDTPICHLVPVFDSNGLCDEIKAHIVPTTHLITKTVVVDTDPAKSAGTAKNAKGGFIYGERRFSYDPGDPSIVSTMYPGGREPELEKLIAAIVPGYALLCWSVDGTDIYEDAINVPEKLIYDPSKPLEITLMMTEDTKVILKLVAVEFCLTFDDGPSGYANPEDDQRGVIPTTRNVLDCLARHSIEATFFVQTHRIMGPHGGGTLDGVALMQRALNEGHTIGVHVGGDLPHDELNTHDLLEKRAGIDVGPDGEWDEGTLPTATIGGIQKSNALISSMIAGKRRLQHVLDYNCRFVRPPELKESPAVYAVYGSPEVNLYNSSNVPGGSDMAFFVNVDPKDYFQSQQDDSQVKERLRVQLNSALSGKYKRIVILLHDFASGRPLDDPEKIRLDDYIDIIKEKVSGTPDYDIKWRKFEAGDFGQYD